MAARFEIFPAQRSYCGQKAGLESWYWRLKAANGEIVAQSEAYSSRAHAERGAVAAAQAAAQSIGHPKTDDRPDMLAVAE